MVNAGSNLGAPHRVPSLRGAYRRPLLPIMVGALAFCAAGAGTVCAQQAPRTATLVRGVPTDLQTVYWVNGCQNLLVSMESVEVQRGDGITLALRPQTVSPRQCPGGSAPGAMVVATAAANPSAGPATVELKFMVTYNTQTGR